MNNEFLFSINHLVLVIIFILFLYTCLKISKNLLPYSYVIEKIICASFILIILIEQLYLIFTEGYSFYSSLPISISNITAFMCISILYFKNYHWFELFFSWALICSFGEIIFFEYIPYDYPNLLYFLSLSSKCLLLFSIIYLVDVKKFKVESNPIKENIILSLLYFAFIFAINFFTGSSYTYFLSNTNPLSVLVFIGCTTIIYLLNKHLNYETNTNE